MCSKQVQWLAATLCSGYRACLIEWAVCGRFCRWDGGKVPAMYMYLKACNSSFHILPCCDTMLLVALLVLALGHLGPHPCQGQLLCLLPVERCLYRVVEGTFCIRVHLQPYRNPLHQG